MSTWTESKITRDLSERDSIEPPEGLLEKLKADIPPDLGSRLSTAALRETGDAEVVPIHRHRRWLLAASLILTVTGGLFAAMVVMRQFQPAEEMEMAQEAPREESAAAAPQAPKAAAPALRQDTAMPEEPAPAPVPADTERKLKSLGYIGKPAPQEPLESPDLQVVNKEEARTRRGGSPRVEPNEAPPFAEAPRPMSPPLLDERRISTGATVSLEELEKIPTARDPWAVLQETPGVQTDRINVGGNESGQQSQYVGPGAKGDQQVWSVDGVVITDMAAMAPAAEPPPPPAPADGRLGDTTIATAGAVINMVAPRAAGVQEGVVGGVAGGVVGGTPGGVVAPQPADYDFDDFEEMPSQDMMFKSTEAHPFVDIAKDRLSTFGLDVDTASYTVARRYLREGQLPPRQAIRVEEFVNYFSYGDPAPARGDFALKAEGAASIFTQEPNTYLLRFNLRAREVKAEHRKPAVLTFVVDVSGSMDQGNRLGLVKQSLGMLLDQLRKDDKVGLVIYGSDARVLLEPTSDREVIRQAIDQLATNGATNAEAGIALGYDVASRSFRPGAINRILLCSDGVANVGATGPEAILGRIQREAKRGIELTTLGFGMGNFNDALMEQLADKGNGRYAYLDDPGEARKVFVEELTGTLQTIAEDAKVQVEFFPAAVTRWRLIGYENRDIPDEKFRDNTVDAGEIGAGHSVTALYEVQLRPEAVRAAGKIASLHLRYRVPVTGALQETVHDLRASELVADWKNASPGFRLASLVVEFAETLRGSSHAGDLHKIQRRAQRVVGEMAGRARGGDVAEFARLVEEAARIKEAAEKK
jgi:Ca-activated chloride channel family protein